MVAKQETLEEIIARIPQWSTMHWQEMESVFDEEQDPPQRPEEENQVGGFFAEAEDHDHPAAGEDGVPKAGRWGDIDWSEIGLVLDGDEQAMEKLEREGESKGQELHDRHI